MQKDKVTPAEEADSDSGVKFRGVDCEQKVRTKIGEDGIPETHVDVQVRRKKSYFVPK